MAGVRKRGEAIREYILQNVTKHPNDVSSLAAKKFGVTRQAVNHHIRRLVGQNDLAVSGPRSRPIYKLRPEYEQNYSYSLDGTLEEDVLWRTVVFQHLSDLPENVIGIWEYGFTEMVNNAIDHSGGQNLTVEMNRDPVRTEIIVYDDGIGIFRKIADALNLQDDRHAVLELAKGKLTTDPDNHTGE